MTLTSLTISSPVTDVEGNSPENSTLVYNTDTVTGVNGVSPGFYFWDTDHWVALTSIETPRTDLLVNNNSSFLNTSQALNDNNSGTGSTMILHTESITLAEDALVYVNFIVRTSITTNQGNLITDGAPRVYGAYITVNGNNYGITTGAYTRDIFNSTGVTNPLILNGSGYIPLSAGTHDIVIRGYAFAGTLNMRATFGNSADDRLQIVAQY